MGVARRRVKVTPKIKRGTHIMVSSSRGKILYEGPERRASSQRYVEEIRHPKKGISAKTIVGRIEENLLRIKEWVRFESHVRDLDLPEFARLREIEDALISRKRFSEKELNKMLKDMEEFMKARGID